MRHVVFQLWGPRQKNQKSLLVAALERCAIVRVVIKKGFDHCSKSIEI